MKLYEIDRADIAAAGGTRKAIEKGLYIIRDDDFVRRAFNSGKGTKRDMIRYMKDNARFCVWIDAGTMQKVSSV